MSQRWKNTSSCSISAARSHGRSGSGGPAGERRRSSHFPAAGVFGMQTQYEFWGGGGGGGDDNCIKSSNRDTNKRRRKARNRMKRIHFQCGRDLFRRCSRVQTGRRFRRAFCLSPPPLSFLHSTRPARMASVTLWPLGPSHTDGFVFIWTVFPVLPVEPSVGWEGQHFPGGVAVLPGERRRRSRMCGIVNSESSQGEERNETPTARPPVVENRI